MTDPYDFVDDIQPIIDMVEQTDTDAWMLDVVRSKDGKRNCFFGHLYQWGYDRATGDGLSHEDAERWASQLWDAFEDRWTTTYGIYPVNDGTHPRYQQPTAKERVLAYLQALQKGDELTTMQWMDEYFTENDEGESDE